MSSGQHVPSISRLDTLRLGASQGAMAVRADYEQVDVGRDIPGHSDGVPGVPCDAGRAGIACATRASHQSMTIAHRSRGREHKPRRDRAEKR